jgi:YebC/PmpR family DNA-binding regulatory protein
MSGHSKWATTKHKKAAKDAKRSAAFTKVGNLISVAARKGGDPETNFSLRLAIDKAKAVNMPKDNIERAIKRGTGELGGETIVERTYEVFGPSGIAMVVEAVTDNLNRTTADIRHALSKHGGSLGAPNSSLWQFSRKGVIRLAEGAEISEDAELELIEAGADDIAQEENLVVYTQPDSFQKAKEEAEKLGLAIENADVELVANEPVKVEEPVKEKLEKLFEALDDLDDVSTFYTNADF